MIDIVIPTLGRPKLLVPLVRNIASTTPVGEFIISFVMQDDDRESQAAVCEIEGPVRVIVTDKRGYPKACNVGFGQTTNELVAIVNDDVHFHSGWYDALIAHSRPEFGVYGTNDLSPSTAEYQNATQPVVARHYIEERGGAWNEPGRLYHEGYHHNFCETELWQLAAQRGVARFVDASVIEHVHPDWGKAELDATYERGAKSNWEQDAALFDQRKARWTLS